MAPGMSDGSDAPQVVYRDEGLEVLESKVEVQAENGQDLRRRLTLCGIRRSRRFWLIAFFALLILLLVFALGAGLGVGLRNRSDDPSDITQAASDNDSVSARRGELSSTGVSPSGSSTNAVSTATTSAASSIPTVLTYSTGCESDRERRQYTPVNNRDSDEPFVADGKTLEFQILCSINYASSSSATNLHITELQRIANESSIEDCITRCASFSAQLPPDTPLDRMCTHAVYRIENEGLNSWCYLQSGSTNNATSIEVEDELATAILL